MRSERGQATTETIALTWIVLIFFAAIYQFHVVNQTIYRSMTAVHAALFARAMASNCASCEHRDVRVLWNPVEFPEVRVRMVSIFQQWRLARGGDLRLYSLRGAPSGACVGSPCKQTTVSAGARVGHFEAIGKALEGMARGFF